MEINLMLFTLFLMTATTNTKRGNHYFSMREQSPFSNFRRIIRKLVEILTNCLDNLENSRNFKIARLYDPFKLLTNKPW